MADRNFVTIDFKSGKGPTELLKKLELVSGDLNKSIGAIAWKTGTKVKRAIAQDVNKSLNILQREVIKKVRLRKLKSSGYGHLAVITVGKKAGLELKRFKGGMSQTAAGVRAQVSAGRRALYQGAFMGGKPNKPAAKLHGHAWKRRTKNRLPIYKQLGPSPWGVIVKKNKLPSIAQVAGQEMRKQLQIRIQKILEGYVRA